MMNCFAIACRWGCSTESHSRLRELVHVPRLSPAKTGQHPTSSGHPSRPTFSACSAWEYLGRTDFVQNKPADGPEEGLVHAEDSRAKHASGAARPIREFETSIDAATARPVPERVSSPNPAWTHDRGMQISAR